MAVAHRCLTEIARCAALVIMLGMPRGPRLDAPDTLHHVIARGIERRRLFRRTQDRRDFLRLLAQVVVTSHAALLAWCLMPNHIHLLWRTGTLPLSQAMRRLFGRYATAFNRRHRRVGHLFQNRFKSILVEEDSYLIHVARYIHLNPLRAGIVGDLAALEQYPWTGHAVLLGHSTYAAQDTAGLLRLFGETVDPARHQYRLFVSDTGASAAHDLGGGALRQCAGSWSYVQPARRGREAWSNDERIAGGALFVESVRAAQRVTRCPIPATEMIDTLCHRVANRFDIDVSSLRGRSCRPGLATARSVVSFLATEHCLISPSLVARALAISVRTVSRGAHAGRAYCGEQNWNLSELLAAPTGRAQ